MTKARPMLFWVLGVVLLIGLVLGLSVSQRQLPDCVQNTGD